MNVNTNSMTIQFIKKSLEEIDLSCKRIEKICLKNHYSEEFNNFIYIKENVDILLYLNKRIKDDLNSLLPIDGLKNEREY